MYRRQIKKINEIIDRTGKAIIGLGCSFVQGQGAFDEELVRRYGTKYDDLGSPLKLDRMKDSEKDNLIKEFPLLKLSHENEIDFTFMEYQNAFTNVLCEKYFNNEYAAINLGIRGCGNRATIKELYLHPNIHWDKLKEIIVVYCPSGPERFDFINDQFMDHGHWVCMWPNLDKHGGPREKLWTGYREALYSEKFMALEQIVQIQELLLWCKVHNAKLIITPSFDQRYNREYFRDSLITQLERNEDGSKAKKLFILDATEKITNMDDLAKMESILDLFPWDMLFYPDNTPTFADMALKQEFGKVDSHNYHFWSYLGTGTPNNWITPCAHPSAKAHDYFAKLLYEKILSWQ